MHSRMQACWSHLLFLGIPLKYIIIFIVHVTVTILNKVTSNLLAKSILFQSQVAIYTTNLSNKVLYHAIMSHL